MIKIKRPYKETLYKVYNLFRSHNKAIFSYIISKFVVFGISEQLIRMETTGMILFLSDKKNYIVFFFFLSKRFSTRTLYLYAKVYILFKFCIFIYFYSFFRFLQFLQFLALKINGHLNYFLIKKIFIMQITLF